MTDHDALHKLVWNTDMSSQVVRIVLATILAGGTLEVNPNTLSELLGNVSSRTARRYVREGVQAGLLSWDDIGHKRLSVNIKNLQFSDIENELIDAEKDPFSPENRTQSADKYVHPKVSRGEEELPNKNHKWTNMSAQGSEETPKVDKYVRVDPEEEPKVDKYVRVEPKKSRKRTNMSAKGSESEEIPSISTNIDNTSTIENDSVKNDSVKNDTMNNSSVGTSKKEKKEKKESTQRKKETKEKDPPVGERKTKRKPVQRYDADYYIKELTPEIWERAMQEGVFPKKHSDVAMLLASYIVAMKLWRSVDYPLDGKDFSGKIGKNASECLNFFTMETQDPIVGFRSAVEYVKWFVAQEESTFIGKAGWSIALCFTRDMYRQYRIQATQGISINDMGKVIQVGDKPGSLKVEVF